MATKYNKFQKKLVELEGENSKYWRLIKIAPILKVDGNGYEMAATYQLDNSTKTIRESDLD